MQPIAKPDIQTSADIDRLIEAFYARVLIDPIIGFFFTDIARIDLQKHLPLISAFWKLQLLGEIGYKGQTFAAHKDLHAQAELTEDHFHRWLYLFEKTIDELFAGPRAETAKQRAHAIARSMLRALASQPISPERAEELRGVQQVAPRRREP
jgi:hemoglobin